MNKEKYISYSPLLGLVATIGLSYLFAALGIWQLVILAAIIGGFISGKFKWAQWVATLGILAGWGLYILIRSVGNMSNVLLDMVGQIIIGQPGFGTYIIIIVLIFGALFGLLGGLIGKYLMNIKKQ